MTNLTTETVELPAFAADTLGETLTLTCPSNWADRVRALAEHLPYGPRYQRSIVYLLRSMSQDVEDGYSAVAYDRLLAAENIAACLKPEDKHP